MQLLTLTLTIFDLLVGGGYEYDARHGVVRVEGRVPRYCQNRNVYYCLQTELRCNVQSSNSDGHVAALMLATVSVARAHRHEPALFHGGQQLDQCVCALDRTHRHVAERPVRVHATAAVPRTPARRHGAR